MVVIAMANTHALLIGVDKYLPNQLPDGGYYPDLHGCVNDVEEIERFLLVRAGVDAARIRKLTASHGAGAAPAEPPERWPTYSNVVAAWKEITAAAAPGDQVYVHYAGHGGRSKTSWPAIKGAEGLDESLVPVDIGNSEARYVRDLEIAELLRAMVEKGLLVTVVLDSCHSGGATRTHVLQPPGVAVRGIASVDTTPRPTASDVATAAELAARYGAAAARQRSVTPASGWTLEPSGYVLLAACRAQESAREYAVEGTSHGALTYWLLDALRLLGPGVTWRSVHQRIVAHVHGAFADQTPQLEGEGDRVVLGSDAAPPAPACALVLEVRGGRLRVQLGQAHGLRAGAVLAIESADGGGRIALATVDAPGAAESWATMTEGAADPRLQAGARATLLDPGALRLRRSVRLLRNDGPPAFWDELATGLGKERGFLRVAGSADAADFVVTVEGGTARLCDAAAELLPNIPPLAVAEAGAVGRVLARLDHLARYANVRELDNRDPLSPLARQLVVELAGWQERYDPADDPAPAPFADPGSAPALRAGTWAFLRFRNRSPQVLNVTVLALQSDWSVKKIFPARAGAFEPFDPGRELLLPMQASLREGVASTRDLLKVLATLDTTDFGVLELPPLDAALPARGRRAAASPLEGLLDAVATTAPQDLSREMTVASTASHDWAAGQVELRVVR